MTAVKSGDVQSPRIPLGKTDIAGAQQAAQHAPAAHHYNSFWRRLGSNRFHDCAGRQHYAQPTMPKMGYEAFHQPAAKTTISSLNVETQ